MTNNLTWKVILNLAKGTNPKADQVIMRTEDEWKSLLPKDVFLITRKKETERPFSSELCTSFKNSLYGCACCGEYLFDSTNKFDSGTGWPSFSSPIKDNSVAYIFDSSHGMNRVEVICNCCQAHLGHVFPDGPPPSLIRFCINALALKKLN